jgi:hypothetical protein
MDCVTSLSTPLRLDGAVSWVKLPPCVEATLCRASACALLYQVSVTVFGHDRDEAVTFIAGCMACDLTTGMSGYIHLIKVYPFDTSNTV